MLSWSPPWGNAKVLELIVNIPWASVTNRRVSRPYVLHAQRTVSFSHKWPDSSGSQPQEQHLSLLVSESARFASSRSLRRSSNRIRAYHLDHRSNCCCLQQRSYPPVYLDGFKQGSQGNTSVVFPYTLLSALEGPSLPFGT